MFRRAINQRSRGVYDDVQEGVVDIDDGVRARSAGHRKRRQPDRPEQQNDPML
jgi:hypothetical protein